MGPPATTLMFKKPSNRDAEDSAARSEMTSLIAGFMAGDARATQELFVRCFPGITGLAVPLVVRMGVRGLIDGEDVANDVLFGIYRAALAGKLRITGVADLNRLIRRLVIRAVLKARESTRAAKRGGCGLKKRTARHEVPIEGIRLVDIDELADKLVDPAASPEDTAVAGDEAERIYRTLDDPSWADIARLRLEGHTLAEIARRTGLAVSSVERRFSQARALWEASWGAG